MCGSHYLLSGIAGKGLIAQMSAKLCALEAKMETRYSNLLRAAFGESDIDSLRRWWSDARAWMSERIPYSGLGVSRSRYVYPDTAFKSSCLCHSSRLLLPGSMFEFTSKTILLIASFI